MAKKQTKSTGRQASGTPKKKAPAKRKASSSKNTAKKGNYTLLIVMVVFLIVAGVAALYYLREFRNDQQQEQVVAEKQAIEAPEEKKQPPKEETKPEESLQADEDQEDVETVERNEDIPEPSKDLDVFYYTRSFDFAWPKYSLEEQIIEHEAYTLAYDEETEQAKWVAYKLSGDLIRRGKVSRTDNFQEDPMVTTGSASLNDYRKSGYDRGHLAPAADFNWSTTAMEESFYMSNMSPQQPGFNRGIWKKLEEMVRDWAIDNRVLYVVTGPIFDDKPKSIGKNDVKVPSAYYKAILDINEPELKAIGFILPHMKSDSDVMVFATTIDDIEKTTGLDFFPLIPDELEEQLESTLNKRLWP